MELMGIFGVGLLSLLVPIALVTLGVGAVHRAAQGDGPTVDPGIGTVRRLFLYGLAFVALGLAATGIALLLGGLLDALFGDLLISASNTELASALSLTVVGLPTWCIFLLLAQRSVRQHTVEHRSLARGFYFLFVRAIALSVVVMNGVQAVEMLAGLEDFRGSPWGWLVVGSAVWLLHQRIVTTDGADTAAARILDRGYLALGSVIGLYALGAGLLTVIIEPGMTAYDIAFRARLVQAPGWTDELTRGVILVGIGSVTWWWHWIRHLAPSETTTAWHVVVFLFGILAGVVAAVVASGVMLYTVLAWAFGVSSASDAAQHFAVIVPAAAFVLVGVGSWRYHHAVLRERIGPDEAPGDAARTYRYLLAAAGLLAASGGFVACLALVIDGLLPISDLVRPGDWWRDQLAVTLTLVLVGGPLWWASWSSAQRLVERGGAGERDALPRRAFIFVVFAVAVLVSLGNLAALLFQLFDAVLNEEFTRETVRDVRWSIAMLATAGAIAGYYWFILRDDQAQTADVRRSEEPEAESESAPGSAQDAQADSTPGLTGARRVRAVVIVGPALAMETAARRLEGSGITVTRVRRLDLDDATVPPSFATELDGLMGILSNFRVTEALVAIDAGGMNVTPIAITDP